jgi:DNA-binding helix-hairpin-helix protein with protein kinase domain
VIGRPVLLGDEPVALSERPLKTGGQAAVFTIVGREGYVVKIYRDPPGDEQARRLASMLTMAPLGGRPIHQSQPPELAWPTALARDPNGELLGYAMPRFGEPGHVQLVGLFTRAVRLRLFPDRADWRFLLGVAWNLAFMTARLHREDLVIGDFSSNNVVVDRDGFVTFLDCDSIAFTDPATSESFPCLMQTADYCAPERQAGGPATAHGDDFALAVLIYQLLTGGNHPFGGVPHDSHSQSTIKDNIAANCSYVVHPDKVTVPPGLTDPGILPPPLLDLARRAFGAADPATRPTAAEWLQALDQERPRVKTCTVRPRHFYGVHLTACPWCERTVDPFNATTPPPARPVRQPSDGPNPALILVAILIALVVLAILLSAL